MSRDSGDNPFEAPRHSGPPGQPPQPLPGGGYDIGQDPAMRLLIPVGLSGWAIAAGYAGLFSLLCFPGPLAILFALLAIRDIRRDPRKHGMGRAIFGLVMGTVGTLILLAMIVSGLARA